MTSSPLALVALGSNVGDSERILTQAFRLLAREASRDFRSSSLWRTEPVDCPPDSPDFLNAAACFIPHPHTTPESLLARLQELERAFGRRPKLVLNEPRPLDLDLIAFGPEQRNTPSLILPHPRAHQRLFVLEPLTEIAPDITPPGWPAPIHRLRHQLASLPGAPNPVRQLLPLPSPPLPSGAS